LNDFSISKSAPSDFLAISQLDRMAWGDNKHSQFIPDGEHIWRIWCEHAVMFTAKNGDSIIGAIVAFRCENGTYCVHKVFVSNDFRGQGIGGLLFSALLKQLDNMRVTSFLTVDPDNEPAIRLYNSIDYEIGELVSGYYRSYENRFVMLRKHKQS
jgi:[ribosomal protein S18]-alanine N-acetyltransferase